MYDGIRIWIESIIKKRITGIENYDGIHSLRECITKQE